MKFDMWAIDYIAEGLLELIPQFIFYLEFKAVEKRINRLGVLCCLGAWWICGLGVIFCLMMRSDFCNNCYKEKFLHKAHERRRLQLYMDDRSLCNPPVGAAEKLPQRRYIVQPK
ncbi:hypothetical protein V3C99_013262 [Haemonchus contortus]